MGGHDDAARWGRPAFLVVLAAFTVAWVWAWAVLPSDGVVHHVGPDGPDGWGSRAGILVPLLLLGPVLFLVLRWLVAVVARHGVGTGLNYPHKHYWMAPERREVFLRRVVDEFDLFWAGTLLLLVVGIVDVVRLTGDPAARTWTLPATGGYAGFVVWWCWWLLRRARPPVPSG